MRSSASGSGCGSKKCDITMRAIISARSWGVTSPRRTGGVRDKRVAQQFGERRRLDRQRRAQPVQHEQRLDLDELAGPVLVQELDEILGRALELLVGRRRRRHRCAEDLRRTGPARGARARATAHPWSGSNGRAWAGTLRPTRSRPTSSASRPRTACHTAASRIRSASTVDLDRHASRSPNCPTRLYTSPAFCNIAGDVAMLHRSRRQVVEDTGVTRDRTRATPIRSRRWIPRWRRIRNRCSARCAIRCRSCRSTGSASLSRGGPRSKRSSATRRRSRRTWTRST